MTEFGCGKECTGKIYLCWRWLHNGWGFDAEVAEGAGHLALSYGGGGEEEGFAGGVGFVEDVVAMVEVVELLG
jgi:hypothetical protein